MDKNQSCLSLYREIGNSLGLEKLKLEKLEKLILILIKKVHTWDDLIDEDNLDIEEALKKVNYYTEQELKLAYYLNVDQERYKKIEQLEQEIATATDATIKARTQEKLTEKKNDLKTVLAGLGKIKEGLKEEEGALKEMEGAF